MKMGFEKAMVQSTLESAISREELDRAFDERFPGTVKEKLSGAKVAVAGLGGLGSNIAVMLARSGVGHLRLVDFDIVDTTNLNRQMYGIRHIGRKKTEAIYEILMEINPYLDICVIDRKVTVGNVTEIFEGYDIVCEAFDKAAEKAMLINSLLTNYKDTVVVSGNGMAGYGDANRIITKQRLRRLYVCGDESADVDEGLGLMAPRVAICAGHQANKVIELILGFETDKNEI